MMALGSPSRPRAGWHGRNRAPLRCGQRCLLGPGGTDGTVCHRVACP